jgi:hypothetical protein
MKSNINCTILELIKREIKKKRLEVIEFYTKNQYLFEQKTVQFSLPRQTGNTKLAVDICKSFNYYKIFYFSFNKVTLHDFNSRNKNKEVITCSFDIHDIRSLKGSSPDIVIIDNSYILNSDILFEIYNRITPDVKIIIKVG